jgi:hypothetical protein
MPSDRHLYSTVVALRPEMHHFACPAPWIRATRDTLKNHLTIHLRMKEVPANNLLHRLPDWANFNPNPVTAIPHVTF